MAADDIDDADIRIRLSSDVAGKRVKAIHVNVRSASRRTAYPIVIEPGLASTLGPRVAALAPDTRRIVVSSPQVWRFVGPHVEAGLPETQVVLVSDGERAKRLRSVASLYDKLVDLGADRRTVMVVIGGGVLGDLAGFAAASFLRGLPLVQVPTTVVAQVDSAIGGKVGVNHPRGKNLIGAFHPPLAVLTDPLLLATLPVRELRAGLQEVVKYGAIASARLFARLERDLARIVACEADALVPVIAECSRIKARVVSIDEHETGLRRILNFGHTVGHALEALTQYRRFLHGEAVGWGMLAATQVARARGAVPDEAAARLSQLVERVGTRPPIDDLSAADCADATRHDKKVVGGTLHFVLPVALGRTEIVADVTRRELLRALRTLGMQS
jgi:3-dehydroquinate synthase